MFHLAGGAPPLFQGFQGIHRRRPITNPIGLVRVLNFVYLMTHTVAIATGFHAFIDLPAWFLSDLPILVARGALDAGVTGPATGARPVPALPAPRSYGVVVFSVSTNARVLNHVGKSFKL